MVGNKVTKKGRKPDHAEEAFNRRCQKSRSLARSLSTISGCIFAAKIIHTTAYCLMKDVRLTLSLCIVSLERRMCRQMLEQVLGAEHELELPPYAGYAHIMSFHGSRSVH